MKMTADRKVEVSARLEDDQRDHLELMFQLDPSSSRNRSTRGMIRKGYVVFFPFEKEIVDGIPFVPRWSK